MGWTNSRRPQTMPPRASPCPPRYLLALWITKSEPSCSGCWLMGGGEGIVGDHQRTHLVSPARQALDINYLERGVSGRLQVEQPAAARDLRLDSVEVRCIAKAGADIDLGQEFAEQLIGAPVSVFDRNDAVPGPQQAEESIADGCHAAGRAGSRFRALQNAHFFFQGCHRGIGVAAVDVARLLPERHLLPVIQVLVAERHALHNWHLGCPLQQRLFLSRPYGLGGNSGVARVSLHAHSPFRTLEHLHRSAENQTHRFLAKVGHTLCPPRIAADNQGMKASLP